MENLNCSEDQKKYDNWSLNNSVEIISRANAPFLNETEKTYIKKSGAKKILDIGCGNGERLFDYLKREQIDFAGLEKFGRFVSGSPYYNDIVVADLIHLDMNNSPSLFNDIDAITILGGSLAGIFCYDNQYKAWEKIYSLLPKKGKVIFDSFKVQGFENAEALGTINLFPGMPPQYFLSESQLRNIWINLGFNILEYSDFSIPAGQIRYYLLEKI
jgi:hypothetical protein